MVELVGPRLAPPPRAATRASSRSPDEHAHAVRNVRIRAPRQPEHLGALAQQLLGQQVAVLAGDAGDERAAHARMQSCRPERPGIVACMKPATGAAVVFVAAAAVLMLEILAARMLAPYVGVSLNTYTGIIGVVLAGIAAGNWVFGRLADKHDPRRLLGPLLIAGGILAIASGPLVKGLGEHVHSDSLKAILALSGATFFLPAFVLSGVTPDRREAAAAHARGDRRHVGRMSGAGTFGALVGTFGTGFFLTRECTRTRSRWASGSRSCASARLSPGAWIRGLGAGAGAGRAGADRGRHRRRPVNGPCMTESAYFCIQVVGSPRDPVLKLDNLEHSSVQLDHPDQLDFNYTRAFAAAIDTLQPPGRPLSALHSAVARSRCRFTSPPRGRHDNTVFDIDPAVVDLARERFGVRTGPRLRVKVGDARLSVAAAPATASTWSSATPSPAGRSRAPHHARVPARRSAASCARAARYLMNLIDGGYGFVRAEAKTMRAVFPSRHARAGFHNFVLIGSKRALDAARFTRGLRRRQVDEVPLTGPALDRFIGGAKVLTDDFAPVDQLLT